MKLIRLPLLAAALWLLQSTAAAKLPWDQLAAALPDDVAWVAQLEDTRDLPAVLEALRLDGPPAGLPIDERPSTLAIWPLGDLALAGQRWVRIVHGAAPEGFDGHRQAAGFSVVGLDTADVAAVAAALDSQTAEDQPRAPGWRRLGLEAENWQFAEGDREVRVRISPQALPQLIQAWLPLAPDPNARQSELLRWAELTGLGTVEAAWAVARLAQQGDRLTVRAGFESSNPSGLLAGQHTLTPLPYPAGLAPAGSPTHFIQLEAVALAEAVLELLSARQPFAVAMAEAWIGATDKASGLSLKRDLLAGLSGRALAWRDSEGWCYALEISSGLGPSIESWFAAFTGRNPGSWESIGELRRLGPLVGGRHLFLHQRWLALAAADWQPVTPLEEQAGEVPIWHRFTSDRLTLQMLLPLE